MANVLNSLATICVEEPGCNPRSAPSYVSSRLLAAATAESITIPAGSAYVRLAGTADFYYVFGAGPATVPGDIDDGTACELVKQQGDADWLIIPPGATTMSVISAGTPIVTASFYKT